MPYTLTARALAVALLLSPGLVGTSSAQSRVESFTALAVDQGANPGNTTISVDMTISRWSTPAEQDALVTALLEQPAKALEVLQKMPAVGRLSATGGVGYELRYAASSKAGGTERILLMTDRPISFGEARSQSRSLDYPITVIELRVQPDGSGEGKVIVAAKMLPNRTSKDIMIENYSIAPVQLKGLKRNK